MDSVQMLRSALLLTLACCACRALGALNERQVLAGQLTEGLGLGLERYHHHHHDAHHTKPVYAYKYSVHDKHTGDVKDAWEHRDGDYTKGGYTVLEPDGHKRIVEYVVTKKGGFQATVKRIPPHHH